jgi:ferrous iron transport protein A
MAATLPRFPAYIPLAVQPATDAALRRVPEPEADRRPAPGSGHDASRAALDPAAVPLTSLRRGDTARVAGVRVSGADADTRSLERMALRLIEIGFVEGEHLRVVAFGQPGHDPIGVRLGGRGGVSSFALRRVEAACVWVVPEPAGAV